MVSLVVATWMMGHDRFYDKIVTADGMMSQGTGVSVFIYIMYTHVYVHQSFGLKKN